MADRCVCGHEEREHSYDPGCDRPVCFGDAMACTCARYRRSPLSAFRGPAVTFSREEAAGWLGVLVCAPEYARGDLRLGVQVMLRDARGNLDLGDHESAAACYLAARILRGVRP